MKQAAEHISHVAIFLALLSLSACELGTKPDLKDGTAQLNIVAVWDSTGENHLMPVRNAQVYLSSEYGIMLFRTDDFGRAVMANLPVSSYDVGVQGRHPIDPQIALLRSLERISVAANQRKEDTIYVSPVPRSGIVINEIYVCGPVNNAFFFYDQYLELYNASDSVRYLDGAMVMRFSGNRDGRGPGADEGDDGDIDGATYVFRFPGTPGGNQYPIQPGEFLVLAQDAINHSQVISSAINLENADWEFFNQFSPNDVDNPNVPNILNMRPDRPQDFILNLVSDVVILSDGRDSVWADGIDISTILDGVEYQPTTTAPKTLDSRVDRGFALGPSQYEGKSMQRREPGYDTNNSTLDFRMLDRPTPKRQ